MPTSDAKKRLYQHQFSCRGKQRLSKKIAVEICSRRKYREGGCQPYRCKACGWWHTSRRMKGGPD